MPKVTLTLDIPEDQLEKYHYYANIYTTTLTQEDMLESRRLLLKAIDTKQDEFGNNVRRDLQTLLEKTLREQRPDDHRSLPEFVIDYIWDDIEDTDILSAETIRDYFSRDYSDGTMTMNRQKAINYLASIWNDIKFDDDSPFTVNNIFQNPEAFLIDVCVDMAEKIMFVVSDELQKEEFSGKEFKTFIKERDDRTKSINPINSLIWQYY